METLLEKIKKSMYRKKVKDYDSWAKDMIKSPTQEALTPKQKKHIDVNDDEKIDEKDFEILRKKKKKVKEEFDASLQEELNEVLAKDAEAKDWIKDFVHSKNPKFEGKSKKKRIQMALAAYYDKQRNEEVENIQETHVHDVNITLPSGDKEKPFIRHKIQVTTPKSDEPVRVKKMVHDAIKKHDEIGPAMADAKKKGLSVNVDINPENEKSTYFGHELTIKKHDPITHSGVNEASKAELAAMAAAAMKSGKEVKKVEAGTTSGLSYKDWKKAATSSEKISGKGEVKVDPKSLVPSATFRGTIKGKKLVRENEEDDTKKNN